MEALIQFLLDVTRDFGYLGIVLFMTAESTFLPVPSELVIPPAAYLAFKGEMNIFLVVACGVAGSILGALINYTLARWLGRPIIYAIAQKSFMKYLFVTHHKLQKSENYFLKYGNISTFIGRLIPGIRHLVSIPAGFVKMSLKSFVFYTFLGSFIWVSILALNGWLLGAHEAFVREYFTQITVGVIGLIILIALGIFLYRKKNR